MQIDSGVKSAARMVAVLALGASLSMSQPAGKIRVWGYNGNGQLGDGLTSDATTAETVVGMTDVVAVSGGEGHSLALKSDGSVWAWGTNASGQLGTPAGGRVPAQVTGFGPGSGVVAIAAGGRFSMALKSDGSVWTWGSNVAGQLGTGQGPFTPGLPAVVNG